MIKAWVFSIADFRESKVGALAGVRGTMSSTTTALWAAAVRPIATKSSSVPKDGSISKLIRSKFPSIVGV